MILTVYSLIPLLTQHLTDEFRLNYCNLWQALITGNQDAVKYYCEELQAGQLYRLLACMVTARAWTSIETGITNSKRSVVEVKNE